MTTKFSKGVYSPKNRNKYVGKSLPVWRSSWEAHFFRFLDEHQSVIQWASEPLYIPYRHPVTGKIANYVPDILMQYIDQNNKIHTDLVEIKPNSQTSLKEARTAVDKIQAIINEAKWESARAFCKKNNLNFRVVSENELFAKQRRKVKTNVRKK
jgi:hypothetical protein